MSRQHPWPHAMGNRILILITFSENLLDDSRSDSLLTVPRRQFCCGSLLHVFGVRVSLKFHLTCVHLILIRFRLLSGNRLGNSYSLG